MKKEKSTTGGAGRWSGLVVAVCAVGAIGAGIISGKADAGDAIPAAAVVTADIQKGIEKYVDEQVQAGGGTFALDHEGQALRLKLVRVHTEYLANLGPREHFACVDLADTSGDLYDVDFFMAGDPGAMTVTATTVHKLNGQPYYAWDQADDGTWQRIPVDRASEAHLGVTRGTDAFEFTYRAVLPQLAAPARMWLPLPETDAFQTVEMLSVTTPGVQREIRDRDGGNRILYVELGPEDSGGVVEMRMNVTRIEKSPYQAAEADAARYLAPDRLVPASPEFVAIAQAVVAGKTGDLVRARAIYDHVIDRMAYIKNGEGWGQGDATYACDVKTGNCTDFHAYFIGVARASGIPARFAIGAGIPSERDAGGVDGYHCWAEFYAEGKWWPVDISEADKYSSLATYYFGHHPANRIEMSRGRDLVVDPLPAGGPINFLAYPLLEVEGKTVKAKVAFTFKRVAPLQKG